MKKTTKSEMLRNCISEELIGSKHMLESAAQGVTESIMSCIEEELVTSKQMLESIAQGITESIMLISKDFKILWANKSAVQQTGLSMDELIGSYCYKANHHREAPCEPPCDPCPLSELINTGSPKSEEHTHYDKSGNKLFVEVAVYPIQDESGHVVSFVHVTRDITERKKTEAIIAQYATELERSNEELDQFASIVSHDLQQPLRVVSGFAQRLHKLYNERLDSEGDKYISYIIDGTEHMQQLISDLLAYAQVGTRGKPFTRVDCNVVLRKALSNLTLAIDETGSVITVDTLPTVLADETQLIELFQNLVGNAIKYCSVRPLVHISAEQKENEYIFRVSDNGIGIEPEHSERIFEVFQRLHTKDEYPGTGIGLSICKKIVKRHGGRIWVESRPGEGSRFFFTIPYQQGAIDNPIVRV